MESFFSSMKTERLSRKVYRTREEARSDVFDYIERFYNPGKRPENWGKPSATLAWSCLTSPTSEGKDRIHGEVDSERVHASPGSQFTSKV